jgi:uncharacterized membrane protein (UPF0127 family)
MRMIRNLSKNAIVADQYRLCKTRSSQALGLMFSPRPEPLIMVFKKPAKVQLHMFLVFFPIDVLCLNERKKVVDLKQDFRPLTLYRSAVVSKYVIELPQGSIKRSKTAIGDKLQFREA